MTDSLWGRSSRPIFSTLRYASQGLFAGILLAAVELWFFRAPLVAEFPLRTVQLRLLGHVVALTLLLFLPLGIVAGWLSRLSLWLDSQGKQKWSGLLWAGLCSPLFFWISFSLFLGGKMQKIPFHPLWSTVIFGLSLIFTASFVPRFLHHVRKLDAQPIHKRLVIALCLFGGLCALHLADLRILPRLYPWFHGSLLVGKMVIAGLIAPLVWFRLSRHFALHAAMFLLCGLTVWQGIRSIDKLRRAMALRTTVIEHTILPSRFLSLIPHRQMGRKAQAIVDAQTQAPSYHGPRFAGRDVFLITIDALRHDEVSPNVTPTLHRLRQQGISFSRAYTQVPHTSFAVATLLTGKPVYALLQLGHDAGGHKTLPRILQNYRYKTAAFYPPSVFFVEHDRLQALEESAYGFEYVKVEYLSGDRRTTQVIDFLETEKPQQVFAWIHYLEPHEPYDVHPGGPDKSRPDRERYDGEVRFVDAEVARLVSYLRVHRPGAVLIVAADHGEEFGEHGGRYHGTTLYDEQARVPLFFVDTAEHPIVQNREYAQPVGLIDVGPTLLGLLDIEPPQQMRGLDLAPWIFTAQKSLPTRAIWSEIGKRKMVVYGSHKLICDLASDSCQVFDLLSDPQEQKNLVDVDPRRTSELRGRLLGLLEESRRFEEAAANPHNNPQSETQKKAQNVQADLSRARLGDRTVVPKLLSLLTDGSQAPIVTQQAVMLSAQLLSQSIPILQEDADPVSALPPVLVRDAIGALRRQLLSETEVKDRRWAAILLTRLGEQNRETDDIVQSLIGDEQAPAQQRLCGALSRQMKPSCRGREKRDCTSDALRVLDAALAIDDPDQVRPLLRVLGESRDGRALAPLVRNLSTVRSRVDVVSALGSLADRRAVSALSQTLLSDPYVHVRAEAARSLAHIGGSEAHSFLQKALQTEREEAVLRTLRSAEQEFQSPTKTP